MSEQSTSAPAPSIHIFLHELLNQAEGTKVRVLCYIREYNAETGCLLVEHAYPDPTAPHQAYVDVNLVLETAKRDVAQDGVWLNVIGYVRTESSAAGRSRKDKSSKAWLPMVQAVLLWSAGSIDVKSYENTLQQQAEIRMQARGILQKAHKALDRHRAGEERRQ